MIGEINDPQDVHMGRRKAKLLRALNMMLGQIFSGLIPIRPLKIPRVQPLCYSRRLVTASLGVEFCQKSKLIYTFCKLLCQGISKGWKEPNISQARSNNSSFVSISPPQWAFPFSLPQKNLLWPLGNLGVSSRYFPKKKFSLPFFG